MTVVRGSTIYDVAKRAKVSIATVSRVLNSPEQVNQSTRARVQQAIEELSFVPRAEASARARKNTRRIGVLAPFFTYPSFVQRLRGVTEALTDSSYELAIYNVDTAERRDMYLSHLPMARRLDGLIVMALPFGQGYVQKLQDYGLETVLIEAGRDNFSSVEIDDEAGGWMVGEYFVGRGHRRCGFIGDSDVPDYAIHTSDRRLNGYRRALSAAGIGLPPHLIGLGPHGLESARRAALQMLSAPNRPTAIFAPSDTQAIGVLRAARDLGMRVPEDLAVVGFDDIDVADYIGLTTVRQPLNESGRVAVDLLLARLANQERPTQRVKLPLALVQRETA